jgi:hypothetical protein
MSFGLIMLFLPVFYFVIVRFREREPACKFSTYDNMEKRKFTVIIEGVNNLMTEDSEQPLVQILNQTIQSLREKEANVTLGRLYTNNGMKRIGS